MEEKEVSVKSLTKEEKDLIKFLRSPLFKALIVITLLNFCYVVGEIIGKLIANAK